MDPEEQRRLDEEARAAAEAQMRALDGLEERTPVVTGEPPPRRVELDAASLGLGEPLRAGDEGEPEPFNDDGYGEPEAPIATTSDYGAQGMREMQHAIDTREHEPASGLGSPWGEADAEVPELARDDMEPLGDVGRGGQMFAPSGRRESPEGRFARLGAGGDFSGSAIAPVSAAAALGLPDEPEAVDSPEEEAAESPELRALGTDTEERPRLDADTEERPRLDAGLPSEDDIASARRSDDIRRPFAALGAGLMTAGGRAAPAFERRADALEAERRAGLRAALASKGATRAQEATQAATSARQQIQDAMAERGLQIRQQQADAATRASEQRGGLVEAQTERTRAQTEAERLSTQFTRATREERQSPESGLSRGYQAAVRARADLIGTEPPADLDAQSAEQLEPQLRAMMQGVGVRRGAGGSGTGAARADTRIAEAVRLGMFDDEATARSHLSAVGADNFDRELVSRQNEMTAGETAASRSRVPLAEGEQGEEVFPGLHAGIRLGTGEGRAIRHDIGAVAGRMASLGRMRQIGEEFGWSGAISPEAAARVRPRLMALRSMAAQIQGTGVINPSEVETINASLPDPTDLEQMTFGTLRAALDEWQGMLEDTVRGNVGETGIGIQEGADALIRRLRTAAERGDAPAAPTSARPRSGAPSAAPGGTVRMRRPDGSIAPNVPASAVARARERGWVQL